MTATATVNQKGRTIQIVGVSGRWNPDATKPLGASVLMLGATLGGVGRSRRMVTLQFATSKAAAAAFGALFFDTACGLADAMPDGTEWTCDEIRRAEKAASGRRR